MYYHLIHVSIHARVERATGAYISLVMRKRSFNPRTRRACDFCEFQLLLFLRSFNPRTRRACDSIDKDGNVVFDVSIHARVERATTHDEFLLFDIVVSIHARVERATLGVYVGFWLTPVSIHARVERATKTMTLLFYRKLCFNPRTRRACDNLHRHRLPNRPLFQSTHA